MKSSTKSSVTLPPSELDLVLRLKRKLRLRSNVEVVRRGLRLLAESTEREVLRDAYRRASKAARSSTKVEMAALDHLAGEGVD